MNTIPTFGTKGGGVIGAGRGAAAAAVEEAVAAESGWGRRKLSKAKVLDAVGSATSVAWVRRGVQEISFVRRML